MTTPDTDLGDTFPDPKPPASSLAATRPFYWSVRRELWENHVYMAPLIVAGVLLFGFLVGGGNIRFERSGMDVLELIPIFPYVLFAGILLITSVIVGLVYSLGALHNERRDRSILFWKSLPVSDLTTVLAKLSLPMVVLPLVTFVIITVLQAIMWVVVGTGLLGHRTPGLLLQQVPLFHLQGLLLYGFFALALWYAPVYGWLFLVSGWAKRATFLWAVLPPIGVSLIEAMVFHTSNFSRLLNERFNGVFAAAFAAPTHFTGHVDDANQLEQTVRIDPVGFLTTPGLWLGLLVAAGFIAAAVRLRRYREPI